MALANRTIPAAVLTALALLYVGSTLSAPVGVGLYHDDGIYVGSALSLANGSGYRIPHLPAAPRQAKYPPLFPLLLVPVAWLTGAGLPGPDGPAGLPPAVLGAFRWPVVLSVLGALALMPGLYRRWGMSERGAIAATALCGLSPLVLQHAWYVMSELPFLLCTVAVFRLLPDREPALRPGRWLGCGACTAAAVLCRAVGVALLPALAVAAWRRRDQWQAWIPLGCGALAFGGWSIVAGAMRAVETARDLGPFYDYYLGYGGWVDPAPGALLRVSAANALDIWWGVGTQLIGWRVLGAPGWLWKPAALALGTLVFVGWRWLAETSRPATVYVAASLLLFVVWPFPVVRFLVPLTPFVIWGAWRGARALGELLNLPPRILSISAGVAIASCAFTDAMRLPSPGHLPLLMDEMPIAAYDEVAAWVREHTSRDDVILSNDDPWVWLTTGRRSIPPGDLDPLWYYTITPEPSPDQWEKLWKPFFEAFEGEALLLGADWIVAGGTGDDHFQVIWSYGMARHPARYRMRFGSPSVDPDLLVFEVLR